MAMVARHRTGRVSPGQRLYGGMGESGWIGEKERTGSLSPSARSIRIINNPAAGGTGRVTGTYLGAPAKTGDK